MRNMDDVIEEFVIPLYMNVLHGNFLRSHAKQQLFINKSKEMLDVLNDREIGLMLGLGWREAITASWIIALGRFDRHLGRIKRNLLPSRMCFSGQFHMIALARIGTMEANGILVEYLQAYLPAEDQQYDQEWAFGALRWLEQRSSRDDSKRFEDSELWKVVMRGTFCGEMSPAKGVDKVSRVMDFIEKHFD